tara:strand:+ start:106 stop:429 length:324 start_codon:yes stop_codon:yes gene_type:complete
MKYLKIYIIIHLALLLVSCSSLKEGFKNQKKGNSDEFLVEKKSPLIMPPDFDELPIPKSIDNQPNDDDKDKIIKSLIINSDSKNKNSNTKNSSNNFEETILEKIKKN